MSIRESRESSENSEDSTDIEQTHEEALARWEVENWPRYEFQIKHCGKQEIKIRGGGEEIWVDGVDLATGELLEAKCIENPAKSPYITNSEIPPFIRAKAVADTENEFRRYAMEYLITPPESTNWKINQNEFIEYLTQTWSDIDIYPVSNEEDYYLIEVAIKLPHTDQKLEIALHRDLQGISLDGSIENCAKFAIWFRSLVPLNQALIFYDQGYNCQIKLSNNTTEEDILQTFVTLAKISSEAS